MTLSIFDIDDPDDFVFFESGWAGMSAYDYWHSLDKSDMGHASGVHTFRRDPDAEAQARQAFKREHPREYAIQKCKQTIRTRKRYHADVLARERQKDRALDWYQRNRDKAAAAGAARYAALQAEARALGISTHALKLQKKAARHTTSST